MKAIFKIPLVFLLVGLGFGCGSSSSGNTTDTTDAPTNTTKAADRLELRLEAHLDRSEGRLQERLDNVEDQLQEQLGGIENQLNKLKNRVNQLISILLLAGLIVAGLIVFLPKKLERSKKTTPTKKPTTPTGTAGDSKSWNVQRERLLEALDLFSDGLGGSVVPMVERVVMLKALDLLSDGLGPKCEDIWQEDYGEGWLQTVNDKSFRPDPYQPSTKDALFLLHGIANTWRDVFRPRRFDPKVLSLVSEIKQARNCWAHQRTYDTVEALRLMERLLEAFGNDQQRIQIDNLHHSLVSL